TAFALQQVVVALVLATDLQHVEDVVVDLDTGASGPVGVGEVDPRLQPGETRLRPVEGDDLAVDDEVLARFGQGFGDLREGSRALLALTRVEASLAVPPDGQAPLPVQLALVHPTLAPEPVVAERGQCGLGDLT